MNKSLLIETANVCLAAFPPLVGFYGVCPAFTQWFLQDQARAFLLGFGLSLAFAVSGIVFAISTLPGEHK